MEILFVSDYVCPYCLVAKEALRQALARTGLQPQITWQPFELTVEPAERVDTWNDKVRRSHYQVLTEPCRRLGLDMKLPPHVVPRPYSRLAFEGYYYAQEKGIGDAYNDLMYRAYFIEELDIGDLDTLCTLASRIGLDPAAYRRALEEGVYSDKLKEANRQGREELHVRHVPSVYIDGTEVSVESYTAEEFTAILTKATESASDAPTEAFGCGPDSCSIPPVPQTGGCGPDGCSF